MLYSILYIIIQYIKLIIHQDLKVLPKVAFLATKLNLV